MFLLYSHEILFHASWHFAVVLLLFHRTLYGCTLDHLRLYKSSSKSLKKCSIVTELKFYSIASTLDMAAKYSINRLIDSRSFELIQRGFVIPSGNRVNHEHIRTVEQIVSGDKGVMIISPQIGLHEDVLALDYDSEYVNLIVKYI